MPTIPEIINGNGHGETASPDPPVSPRFAEEIHVTAGHAVTPKTKGERVAFKIRASVGRYRRLANTRILDHLITAGSWVFLVIFGQRYTAGPPNSHKNLAYDIQGRRKFYRWIDYLMHSIRIRALECECTPANLHESGPRLGDELHPNPIGQADWQRLHEESLSLVRHDDALNWQKFYNLAVLNAGLLAVFGVGIQYNNRPLQVIIACFGILIAYLFDSTFQEGMRCLRGHRLRVDLLEGRKFGAGKQMLFSKNPYNHRDALEIGPILIFLSWIALLLVCTLRSGGVTK